MGNDGSPRVAVAGAGSVGCYVGACLALAGRDVALLMRDRLARPARRHGIEVCDLGGSARTATPGSFAIETDPARALKDAELVLVTVKSSSTGEIAGLIKRYAPGATVVSVQNGVGNVQVLKQTLGPSTVIAAAMVPFNVVQTIAEGAAPRFLRATSGTLLVGSGTPGLQMLLDVPGLEVREHNDMTSVLWSKLVLNMNNALNALSGLPLVQELADPDWRKLLAGQMDEALAAIGAAGIALARIEGVHPKLIPHALRLPTPLFRLVARKMLAIDPDARSSMWEDFQQGRKTEIDFLQGAVIDLAKEHGRAVPLCERVVALVKEREEAKNARPLTPKDILAGA